MESGKVVNSQARWKTRRGVRQSGQDFHILLCTIEGREHVRGHARGISYLS